MDTKWMSQIGISIQINTQIKVYIVKFYIYKKNLLASSPLIKVTK